MNCGWPVIWAHSYRQSILAWRSGREVVSSATVLGVTDWMKNGWMTCALCVVQVTGSMAGVVKAMESAMRSMNLEKVSHPCSLFQLVGFTACLFICRNLQPSRSSCHMWARGNPPPPYPFTSPIFYFVSFSIFYFLLFPCLLALSIFLLFYPFPFYQNRPTVFPGPMS